MKKTIRLLAVGAFTLTFFACSTQPRSLTRDPATSALSVEFVPSIVVDKGAIDKRYEDTVGPLLDSATKSIDVIQFEFASESGFVNALAQKLITLQKKNPKLKIRVILEKEGFGAGPRSAATQKLLAGKGIEVHLVTGLPDPHGGPNGIVHTKLVNVDESRVLAGSTNWTNTSIEKNNETNLLITSTSLSRELTAYADALVQDPKGAQRKVLQEGNVTLYTDTAYYDALISFLQRGKSGDRLDCSMYFFNIGQTTENRTTGIMTALLGAAKRGVKTRIMLEQGGFSPVIDKENKLAAKQLKAGGAEVYLDQPAKISHQKFCILTEGSDRSLILGSTNWNYLDIDLNHQVNWSIEKAGKTGDALFDFFDHVVKTEGIAF